MRWNYRLVDTKLRVVYYKNRTDVDILEAYSEAGFDEPFSEEFYTAVEDELRTEQHGDVLVFSDFKDVHGLEPLAKINPKVIPPETQPRDRN